MEIQGVWLPLDVLKYITQFLWVSDHRVIFKRVCKVFYRALRESPPLPKVVLKPRYISAQGGVVTTVDLIECRGLRVTVIVLASGWIQFCLIDEDELLTTTRTDYPGPRTLRTYGLTVGPGKFEYFCPAEGKIDKSRTLIHPDREAILMEIQIICQFAQKYFSILYAEVNERKLLKHKRPRKRVKRLGFDV